MPRKKFRQVDNVTIHCCCCLQQGETVPAFTVAKSYAVCEKHLRLVSKPGFDIFSLQAEKSTA